MTQTKAVASVLKGIRISPTKLRLVADLIRGMKADKALIQLTFSKKRIAKQVYQCLFSAISNAENNHNMDVDRLKISEIYVDKGFVMKRMIPKARGRSGSIKKFFSHLTIKVAESE